MALNSTDWIVIAAYLLLNLAISLYYRRRSSGSTEEFFVSGRNVSWWLAGTSMVATTFAADTPLFVTGVVAKQGISGNWIWWWFPDLRSPAPAIVLAAAQDIMIASLPPCRHT